MVTFDLMTKLLALVYIQFKRSYFFFLYGVVFDRWYSGLTSFLFKWVLCKWDSEGIS